MDPYSLAPSHNGTTCMTSGAPQDPDRERDGRVSSISHLPARPPKAALLPAHAFPPSTRQPVDSGYDASLDEKRAYRQSYNNYSGGPALVPGTSVSSTGGASVLTGRTTDTIDLEKAAMEAQSRRQSESRRSSRVSRPRQETAERPHNPYFPASGHASGNSLPYDRTSVRSEYEDEQEMLEQRRLLESKAPNILLFLSGPCAALSFLLCGYAFVATLAIFVSSPLRLCCTFRSSLWEQLLSTLTSAQRLHLRCIYAPTTAVEGKSVAGLLFNLLLSPILSMGVAVAAWTVAIYWVFAAVVGDPDGSEGGDDGRATVVGLRKWWESWLSRAIRDD